MLTSKGLKGLSLTAVMEEGVPKSYAVFCNTEHPRWYNRYLMKGFQHVWVLHYDGYAWYKLEHTYSGESFKMVVLLDGWAFNACQDITRYYKQQPNTKVLEVDRDSLLLECVDKIRSPFIVVGSTCVEHVKNFMCIRKWWCFTPYQLYKYICKTEGK